MNDFPLESFPTIIARHSLYRDDRGRERQERGIRKDFLRRKSPKPSLFELVSRTPSPPPSPHLEKCSTVPVYVSWGNGLRGLHFSPRIYSKHLLIRTCGLRTSWQKFGQKWKNLFSQERSSRFLYLGYS